jgi:hypothetical protein
MLQISTGKFFRDVELYTTPHRGLLYSNYRLAHKLETVAGSLSPIEGQGEVAALLFEADERLEAIAPDGRREFLASVGGATMIQDFAAVTSFSLDITCTPDRDLAHRLTLTTNSPLGIAYVPRQYLSRVFDASITPKPTDRDAHLRFVTELIGLHRRTFEAALRAVRRYVTGLHRISDDLDLAYTLLVASIESLAPFAEDVLPGWEDLNPQYRTSIDTVLEETQASGDTRERVRSAILIHEHVALKRRYRDFTLAHIKSSFFREEAVGRALPVRRNDIKGMIERAYDFRSKYVHTLRELPKLLTMYPEHGDTAIVDGQPLLTLQGLARLARHVIRTFIEQSPKIEREEFDYRRALPNTVSMPLSETFWIGLPQSYNHHTSRRYLSGFLSQLARALMGESDSSLTDLTQVMNRLETLLPGLSSSQRLPMLVLYGLYNSYISPNWRRPRYEMVLSEYEADFYSPSVEGMIAHLLRSKQIDWPADELVRIREEYLNQRRARGGILLPLVFESALVLSIAEAYRAIGDDEMARRFIAEAVEDAPGNISLQSLEASAMGGPIPRISWRDLLLPVTSSV